MLLSSLIGKQVLCARSSTRAGTAKDDTVLSGVVPLVRVLWMMGMRTLVLGFPVTSLVDTFPVGSTVLVSDHINLTGMNPLFGHNEDRYGARFPDCSNLYHADSLGASDPATNTGVLASLSGWCDVSSPCERRWLLNLGAQLVVRGESADAAIVARQMGIRTTAVAVISYSAADNGTQNKQAQWLPNQHVSLTSHVASLFHAINTAL